jgi:hypothetical protein
VFALAQGINAGKEDENTEQQPVRQPTPDQRMVKDIPGGYISGGDDHDYKDQIADNLAGPFNDYINPAKKFIDDLTHCSRLSFGFPISGTGSKYQEGACAPSQLF